MSRNIDSRTLQTCDVYEKTKAVKIGNESFQLFLFCTGSFQPDFFCVGYQIKVFYSMIIFVGAVKIIDGEDESWKTRIIHSQRFS